MLVQGRRFYVKELKKDLTIDGLQERYDESNPFMLCEIIEVGKGLDSAVEYQNPEDKVLLTSRGNKIPFRGGYFVEEQYVLAVFTREEYNNL